MDSIYKRIKYSIILPLFIGFLSPFKKKMEKDNLQPVFILGAGRNGSTLLALILNRHSKLFLPPEQTFLPYAIMKEQLALKINWEEYVRSTLDSFQGQNQEWNYNVEWIEEVKRKALQFPKEKQRISILFDFLFRSYAHLNGINPELIGDHSPVTTFFYKIIFKQFPKAYFIFLVRDPIDSAFSYKGLKNNPASDTSFFCWKWKNSVRAYQWISKQKNSRIALLRYEDLVSNPKQEIPQLLKFLNLSNEDLINGEQQVDPNLVGAGQFEHHKNLYKPISPSSIGKGHKNLDQSEKDFILRKTKRFLSDFDYDGKPSSAG